MARLNVNQLGWSLIFSKSASRQQPGAQVAQGQAG